MLLLRRSLNRRIGRTGLAVRHVAGLWAAAAIAAAVGWAVKLVLHDAPGARRRRRSRPYGLVFFATTYALACQRQML